MSDSNLQPRVSNVALVLLRCRSHVQFGHLFKSITNVNGAIEVLLVDVIIAFDSIEQLL
jgi:hypothetical protein